MEKKRLKYPVIVEGKYDKNTLLQIFDAHVITLSGFAIFNSREKQALIKRIAGEGIILLTDSDGGGRQIRSFLLGILPPERVKNVYIPKIAGKEKRKTHASRSGLLGVEGMSREVLEKLLSPFVIDGWRGELSGKFGTREITKLDLYQDGLSGGVGSAERRRALAARFDLPDDMTAKALLEALNLLVDYNEYKAAILSLK